MKKRVTEDWQFELTATEGSARSCRLGIERGDRFVFSYGCPEGICPMAMMEVFTGCEVIRCGGDFTFRGEKERYQMDLTCPCASIRFRLKAAPIHRDREGNPLPNRPRSEVQAGRRVCSGEADCHLLQGVL